MKQAYQIIHAVFAGLNRKKEAMRLELVCSITYNMKVLIRNYCKMKHFWIFVGD